MVLTISNMSAQTCNYFGGIKPASYTTSTLMTSTGRNPDAKIDYRNLSDDEILNLIQQKLISPYQLEKLVGDKDERAVRLRRAFFFKIVDREKSNALSVIPYLNYDYSQVTNACCENVLGYVPVPLGYAGPITVDGHACYVPLATTEGCLVASINRGCRAISSGSGVETTVVADLMTRGPVVGFNSMMEAAEFKLWIEQPENVNILRQQFDATSRFVQLKKIQATVCGRFVYVRFGSTTGDAMGMNMVSKATEAALTYLHHKGTFPTMQIISLSGNYCVDKKASAMNWIEGRGKSVVAEAVVPGNVVRETLKSTVEDLVELNVKKNLIGSAMAGVIGGFNAHSANIVAAMFLATGQDIAQIVGSCNCLTQMEATAKGDLRISCTMPSLEVGTVGGGTLLPAQKACLKMMGVAGGHPTEPGANARQLARIICAVVLAGELSLMSALSAGHLVRSHMMHNRSSANLQKEVAEEVSEKPILSQSGALNSSYNQLLEMTTEALKTANLHPESCSRVLT